MSSAQAEAVAPPELTALPSKCLNYPVGIQILTIKMCYWFHTWSNKKANCKDRIIMLTIL